MDASYPRDNTPIRPKLANNIALSQCYMYITQFGFTQKQIVKLKGVNRIFYKRLAQWVGICLNLSNVRSLEIVCHRPDSTVGFEWPTRATIDEMLASGVLHLLTGFENNVEDGTGSCFNWILSNG